jgi:uncharacterized membrane protein YedE/YeeE
VSNRARQAVLALAAGLLFGVGLVLSGMTQPSKVLAFLDVTGDWDASLLVVMAGAVTVFALAHRWSAQRSRPLLAERFVLPTKNDIDPRLISGAALFGIGWGIAGYCPGPALTSLARGGAGAVVFTLTMLVGIALGVWLDARPSRNPTSPAFDRPASEQ